MMFVDFIAGPEVEDPFTVVVIIKIIHIEDILELDPGKPGVVLKFFNGLIKVFNPAEIFCAESNTEGM